MGKNHSEGRTMTVKLVEWTLFVLIFSVMFVFKWAAILIIAVVFAAWTLT